MMEPPAQDLDTDAAIDPERRGTATAQAADQQHSPGYQQHAPEYYKQQAPADQQQAPADQQHAPITSTVELYDVAIAFAKGDEEIADDIMTKLSNFELPDGTKPKVCLFDELQCSPNEVEKAQTIFGRCTLIYVVLTKNLKEDPAATFFINEAIAMTRLASEHDEQRRSCVRPLHTLSMKEREGVYTVPGSLSCVESLDWYNFGNPRFNAKLVETLEYYLPYRRQRESLY